MSAEPVGPDGDEPRVASLSEVPLFADTVDTAAPHAPDPATRRALNSYGVLGRDALRDATLDLPTPDLDWAQVVELRRRASEEITEESEHQVRTAGQPLGGDDRLLMGRSIIRRVVADHVRSLHREGAALWSPAQEQAYVRAVEDAVFGYGRLQPLLQMPDVENIEIHGWDSVVVQYGDGRREQRPPVADSDADLVDAIRFLGQNSEPSRPFDDTHPTMTLALGERFRLHAIGFGLSYRPSVVIRQHTLTDVSLAELSDGGLMPLEVAEFLDAAILARKSIVISGDQGAGKTTLLRALINAIPANERFGTLETDYELMTHLQPGRENILALQARVGHGETAGGSRVGDFSIADLMPEALRQNLSRLVVGEVRGSEAAAMFEAMQAGTGTLSTTHSHSAESTIDRLASRVAQGGVLGVEEAYRQIAHNIHLFVYVRLLDETWRGGVRRRFVSEVRQVVRAIENGRPVTHLTYAAVGSPGQPAGFFPEADFEAELVPFRRELPGPARPEQPMTAAVAVLAGLLVAAGALGVVAGLVRREPAPRARRRTGGGLAETWARRTHRPPGARGRQRDLLLVGSVAGGFVLAALSSWLVSIVVVPGLVLGLPYLLRMPRPRDVALLEALDRWVRSLAATLGTGKSITDAIRISRRTAPEAIADEVNTLVLRLNNRWETRDALVRFADGVSSPDADAVVAALMLAVNRGADGAAVTLNALADSIQSQLKARRVIEVERSKPYVVVRQVTVISLVTLGAIFAFQPSFFAAYRTPLGQVVLAVLVTLYFSSLLLMRRKARQPERPRILVSPEPVGGTATGSVA